MKYPAIEIHELNIVTELLLSSSLSETRESWSYSRPRSREQYTSTTFDSLLDIDNAKRYSSVSDLFQTFDPQNLVVHIGSGIRLSFIAERD